MSDADDRTELEMRNAAMQLDKLREADEGEPIMGQVEIRDTDWQWRGAITELAEAIRQPDRDEARKHLVRAEQYAKGVDPGAEQCGTGQARAAYYEDCMEGWRERAEAAERWSEEYEMQRDELEAKLARVREWRNKLDRIGYSALVQELDAILDGEGEHPIDTYREYPENPGTVAS